METMAIDRDACDYYLVERNRHDSPRDLRGAQSIERPPEYSMLYKKQKSKSSFAKFCCAPSEFIPLEAMPVDQQIPLFSVRLHAFRDVAVLA